MEVGLGWPLVLASCIIGFPLGEEAYQLRQSLFCLHPSGFLQVPLDSQRRRRHIRYGFSQEASVYLVSESLLSVNTTVFPQDTDPPCQFESPVRSGYLAELLQPEASYRQFPCLSLVSSFLTLPDDP